MNIPSNPRNETLTAIQERQMAVELIRRHMRLGFVKYLLIKLRKADLPRLWREIHPNEKTTSGCLPGSCSGLMKTPFQRVYGAGLLTCYLEQFSSVSEPVGCIIDPATLCSAWDMVDARMKHVRPESCDINLMYLLVHDYVAKQVELVRCPTCHCNYLKHANWVANSKYRRCPHCELAAQAAA